MQVVPLHILLDWQQRGEVCENRCSTMRSPRLGSEALAGAVERIKGRRQSHIDDEVIAVVRCDIRLGSREDRSRPRDGGGPSF